ncbi:hypothetical protein REPUB_Repub01dG0017900 [Reevesia pubescens]
MKFGKEFASQMVLEWQEAYVDYDYLKTLLKGIQTFKQRTKPQATLNRSLTRYRAFSGLLQRHYPPEPLSPSSLDIEVQPVLVTSINRDGSQSYQTTFLRQADNGENMN